MANVLIIKLGALGDVIMATPIIKQLQHHHANDKLWLLTTTSFLNLFKNWEDLQVAAFSRKGFFSIYRAVRWIRQHKFEILYDLQSNDRTSIISALSGIPKRVGNHPRFPYHLHPDEPYVGQCHAYERLNQMLISADIEPSYELPQLPVAHEAMLHVKKWLDVTGLASSRFVLLHAGASLKHVAKRWPYFLDLALELQSKGFKVVWIGADDDSEINRALAARIGIDATSLFDVIELLELGKYACFAVTNDSAPMHILSCSNIPVFGLFGPTNWRRTHALGQQRRVITPTADINSQNDTFKPLALDKLSVQHVLERLNNDGLI
ncbi:MAG: glycosyltransferase family 9 protein [Gammaproteobacteria bacterium]|nr:glycosyltransferase family 9 protein [Gammaproteobacteria bacterium]